MLKEWAEKRFEWKSLLVGADPCHPLPLRMIVLVILRASWSLWNCRSSMRFPLAARKRWKCSVGACNKWPVIFGAAIFDARHR